MKDKKTAAEFQLAKQSYERALAEKFEELRPKPYASIFSIIAIACLGGLFENYSGKTFITIPVLIITIYLVVKAESDIIHKRIDVLHKLLSKKNEDA